MGDVIAKKAENGARRWRWSLKINKWNLPVSFILSISGIA
jgi:hypothetical protein